MNMKRYVFCMMACFTGLIFNACAFNAEDYRKALALSDKIKSIPDDRDRYSKLKAFGAIEKNSLQGADLSGANLQGVDLERISLMHANLQGANLSYSILLYADLSEANLIGANLEHAKLLEICFKNAKLCVAKLHGAHLAYSIDKIF